MSTIPDFQSFKSLVSHERAISAFHCPKRLHRFHADVFRLVRDPDDAAENVCIVRNAVYVVELLFRAPQ